MGSIGIIPNPASGHDIRRLVAKGAVFSNNEKVNIVQRLLLGLASTGVENVYIMHDYFGIGNRALFALDSADRLPTNISWLRMEIEGNQEDSTRAAELMEEFSVGCIVTVGGDGTNRVVTKGCRNVPILPISTGTNNVFPWMVEGTIAGIAAGLVARGLVDHASCVTRSKMLEILRDGEVIDLALVDAVVYDTTFRGTKAIWEVAKLQQIVTTWSEACNIGTSSIGGSLLPIGRFEPKGLSVTLGEGDIRVLAPIAPGIVKEVGIQSYKVLEIGSTVEVGFKPSVIALDGEREVEVRGNAEFAVRLSDKGPLLVHPDIALREAALSGLFSSSC